MAILGKILFSHSENALSRTLDFSQPILIFFSASWCTFSNSSTSKLIDFYNESNKSNKKIEIIYITSKCHGLLYGLNIKK